ncbi:zinc-binding alcohol dehydrogenase [Paenibacillus thermoaerophilus]|uniref:Zinc-binding alcohol dehydrogenase n=1 Tax=Paenibacillus thermoaerophilus TaxID=1215385 RepID=A0ABW2V4L4_9BACL|nr:zinc-binding alcohol dehydrogenase [Paenibacillus thermoaerophilus]TMV11154.1 zinc-binding alcohol dehydrogenase [Paenibacillus thermoaerophilus]
MKAVAAKQGRIVVIDAQEPELLPGHVLIRTEYSAISPGTEMSMLKASGETPVILGYSAVGIVERVGEGVTGFAPGQRAACYGAPYVRHAGLLAVPANLAAVVPEGVSPEEAAFAGLGAIAIHALRTADLRFGESAVVVGLGLLGNLTAQIASAAAFRTIGHDLNEDRVRRMRELGVPAFADQSELEANLPRLTGGAGADSVLLCVGGPGEALMNQALEWIRDRGKLVIVGDITAQFSRGAMFAKEAQVLISRAGGPGRYDRGYERDNRDYPIGYVRWTEGRNTAEYIRLLAERKISVAPLITDVYPVERADEAYRNYAELAPTVGTLLKHG